MGKKAHHPTALCGRARGHVNSDGGRGAAAVEQLVSYGVSVALLALPSLRSGAEGQKAGGAEIPPA